MTEPRRRALGWIGTRLSDHRAELVEVRDEVDSMRRAMDERIATAGKALRMMCERALSRRTQGELLAKKQMVQDDIATSFIQLEQFRLLGHDHVK